MAVTRSEDPLVWIDCEMTGLDHTTDVVLSISCHVTSAHLEPLDPLGFSAGGYHAVIATPASTLGSMSPWCIDTHTRTGLVSQCLASTTTAEVAAAELLAYVKRYVPEPRRALLAGNSVHVDKLFLMKRPWTPVVEWLHYRILDVSAIKEGVRRWCGDEVVEGVPRKKEAHSASEDVVESIEEARCYMGLFKGLGRGER